MAWYLVKHRSNFTFTLLGNRGFIKPATISYLRAGESSP